jgi:hypothetical protein
MPRLPTAPQPTDPPTNRIEAISKVKRATVFIKATLADGDTCSGSGFLCAPDARNLVVTNIHVVGMLSADSRRPRSVAVVLNCGRSDERTFPAEVVCADGPSGLAVLDLGEAAGLPEPPSVKPAGGLREQTELQALGLPQGEGPGKEVTLRPTTLLSLHTTNGVFDRIQVDGSIEPGTSGGPVVDPHGQVIGVAVAASPGQPPFVIPGERVQALLNGCCSEMDLQEPFALPGPRISMQVVLAMADPRRCIREVGLDVWVGNRPAAGRAVRPPAQLRPPPEPGDQARQECKLVYKDGRAEGEVVLPPLTGQTYWVQPTWVDGGGQTRWGTARPFIPEPPLTRTAAVLALRPMAGATRTLELKCYNTFRVSGDEDDDEGVVARLNLKALFNEQVAQSSPAGATVRLRYLHAAAQTLMGTRPRDLDVPSGILHFAMVMQFDGRGNLKSNLLDPVLLRQALLGTPQQGEERMKKINVVHEPIKSCLETLMIPLPGKQVVPRETWTTTRRVMVSALAKERPAQLELTCTYLGQRPGPKGADEAVLSLAGVLRGLPGRGKDGSRFAGKATGTASVDLSTGQVTRCRLRLTTDTEVTVDLMGRPQALRALHVQSSYLRVAIERVGG